MGEDPLRPFDLSELEEVADNYSRQTSCLSWYDLQLVAQGHQPPAGATEHVAQCPECDTLMLAMRKSDPKVDQLLKDIVDLMHQLGRQEDEIGIKPILTPA